MRMLQKHYRQIGLLDHEVSHVVPVDITDVAQWFYEGTEKEEWVFSKDFPCVSPPWPMTWMEFKCPKTSHSEGYVKPGIGMELGRLGGMFIGERLDGRDSESIGFMDSLHARPHLKRFMQGDEKWIMFSKLFAETFDGDLVPFSKYWFILNEQGMVVPGDEHRGYLPLIEDDPTQFKSIETMRHSGVFLFPFLMALTFLHCKNVEVVSQSITPKTERQHAREKKPLIRYKTLTVSPVKKMFVDEGQMHKTGFKQALHLCRGHFKDYREGRGLFGKVKGLFWWDMLVRGKKEQGEVRKEYEVKPI